MIENLNGYCDICGARINGLICCDLCNELKGKEIRALANGVVLINGYPTGRIHELRDDARNSVLYYASSDGMNALTVAFPTKSEALSALNIELNRPIESGDTGEQP